MRIVSVLAASLALVTGLSGCQAVNGSTAPVSQLRIIDATPDAGGVDIYANNSAIAYNLGFGTVTSYVPTAPATYTLQADTAGSRTVIGSARATLAVSKQYTLLLSNVAASLSAQVLTDQSMPAPSGQVALRFLDESLNAGPVDIYMVPGSSTLAKSTPLVSGVTFGANTGYLDIPTGTYTLYLVQSGTTLSSTTVPLYTGAQTSYPVGAARTFVLLDQQLVTTPALQVITANDYDSATATQ